MNYREKVLYVLFFCETSEILLSLLLTFHLACARWATTERVVTESASAIAAPQIAMETNGCTRDQSDFTSFKAPLYLAWESTHRCNAFCVHCYSASGPDCSREQELSTDEGLSLIDQLADAGLMVLAFSGGEPLLRSDWRLLAEHAAKRGLVVNIGTNGSTIQEQTADTIAKTGVRSVTVSLDSHAAGVHDSFRRCAGLFEQAVNAIRLLVERKVRVVVGFTPTKINWKHGPALIELAAKLGADAVNLSQYVPAGRGTVSLALMPDQLHQVLEEWIGLRKQYQGRLQVIWHDCRVSLLAPPNEKRDYLGCGAGRLVARILPNGDITPCVFLPSVIGSLRAGSFEQIWSRSTLLKEFRIRTRYTGNCRQCDYLQICGGCRAVAFAYSKGDPLAGDPHCWIKPDTEMPDIVLGEALPY